MNQEIIEQRFTALDAEGNEFLLTYKLELLNASHMQDSAALMGNRSIETDTGIPLNYLSKGRYKLPSGVEVESKDPNAP